jgi:hypothetical protein
VLRHDLKLRIALGDGPITVVDSHNPPTPAGGREERSARKAQREREDCTVRRLPRKATLDTPQSIWLADR